MKTVKFLHRGWGVSRDGRHGVQCRALALAALLMMMCASKAMAAPPAGAVSCESLATLALPHTTITLAKSVPAGDFTAPPFSFPVPHYSPTIVKSLPAFCRVTATASPTPDSVVKFEVWLPAAKWNGKFQGVGNGGWAGNISYGALGAALQHDFATASTDTGHEGRVVDAHFALGHPEKLEDFSERAVHLMTVQAKAIIVAYYGSAPTYSYWNGCSCGGRQALVEAQRYPHDYNGIAAGAPANYWVHLMVSELWPSTVALASPTGYIPAEKHELLFNAALAACDTLDGVADHLINDPTRCHFDPEVLACKGADAPDCLTATQVEAARRMYAGPTNPRTGQQIFPGLEPGSELGWRKADLGEPSIGGGYFQYVLFKNPQWTYRDFDYDRDVALADRTDPGHLNAITPDLKAFRDSGGKLLQYHGWADPAIHPRSSVNYYQSVVAAMGGKEKTEGFYRLFMLPGVGHCTGGLGPDTFDKVGVLEQWVEHGIAPEKIIAAHRTKEVEDMTRPLCPYPQVAKWKGSGSTNDAANFVCVMEDPQKGGSLGSK
jgi:feruloyl esterase